MPSLSKDFQNQMLLSCINTQIKKTDNRLQMLPAHRALVCILAKCHWPRNDTGVTKHVIIVTESTVICNEKTATKHYS